MRDRRLIALLFVAVVVPAARGAGLTALERERLAAALACVNIVPRDLEWDKRPVDDAFRLAIVDRCLDEPLTLAEACERAESDFGGSPLVAADAVAAWMAPAGDGALRLPASSTTSRDLGGRMPASAEPLLEALVGLAGSSRAQVDAALAGLSPSQREMLRAKAAGLYLEEGDVDPAILEAARLVDLSRLARVLHDLAAVARTASGWTADPAWTTRVVTIDGLVVALGGAGDDVHRGADVVLDGGGDDRHEGCGIVVDLAGDDTHRDCGRGLFAAGLVVDVAGADRHLGGDVSLGGAVGGAALLLDLSGDDAYVGSQLCEGAGVLGFGLLMDVQGDDSFRAARFAQGFGGVRGLGALSDQAGADTYWAGGQFLHEPLLPENFQSLSQGFGFGLRPDASGGVGILVDREGNDAYHAEVYGQGSAYWLALGLLVDSAGHDRYALHQYGQGAGIHLAAGALIDRAGTDAYSCLNGVAQGSGHDWAVGLLWDRGGADGYQGSGMSQGGANANAIGLLIDDAGNDSYAGWNERNQGDSFPARGSVGLGVLLDLGGRDRYTHGGADSRTWTRGHVGVGMDWEPEVTP